MESLGLHALQEDEDFQRLVAQAVEEASSAHWELRVLGFGFLGWSDRVSQFCVVYGGLSQSLPESLESLRVKRFCRVLYQAVL